jgi:hypothetical protein
MEIISPLGHGLSSDFEAPMKVNGVKLWHWITNERRVDDKLWEWRVIHLLVLVISFD